MSTLPERMRQAADAIDGADLRISGELGNKWDSELLRRWANNFEAEDRAAAEQEALVEQLAQTIHDHGTPSGAWEDARDFVQDPIRSSARAILANFDVTPKTTGSQEEQA